MTTPCPECGRYSYRQENFTVLCVPSDDIFKPPCQTCEQDAHDAMADLGKKHAEKINLECLKIIFGEESVDE